MEKWRIVIKYRLKNTDTKGLPYYRVCIVCGKKELAGQNLPNRPLPNTTVKISTGGIGFAAGTKRACWTGNHDFYFEHEVEKV